MWTNSFPFFFWRSDVIAARKHLTSGHLAEIATTPTCAYANAFDRAFAAITNASPVWGFKHRRKGYSQFNLLANFMLHHHPEGYAFHLIKTKPTDLATLQKLHPHAKFLAADAGKLGGATNAESSNEGGFVVPAMNAEDVQGVVPIMRRVCCATHPSLHHLQGCQELETVEAKVKKLSSKAGKATDELEAASKELAAMDKTFGNAGHCYGRPAGDQCAQIYETVTREFIEAAPESERLRAEKACEHIVEQFAPESPPPFAPGSSQKSAPKRGQRHTLAMAKDSEGKENGDGGESKEAPRESESPLDEGKAPKVESEEIDGEAGKNEMPAAIVGILAGAVLIGHRAGIVLKRNSGKAS